MALISFVVISSCMTLDQARENPDPFKPINRVIFSFNNYFYTYVLDPLTELYVFLVPPTPRQGINNAFSNVSDITVAANYLLQLDINNTLKTTGRFGINTTIGILGLFDPATSIGLPKQHQGFGLTLAHYGMKESPYIVIPFLGPSTLRDGAGLLVDYYALSPWPYLDDEWLYPLTALDVIRLRSNFLDNQSLIQSFSLDSYTVYRNAYLQYRRAIIYDGRAPAIGDDYDPEFDDYDDYNDSSDTAFESQ